MNQLTRREFLRLCGTSSVGLATRGLWRHADRNKNTPVNRNTTSCADNGNTMARNSDASTNEYCDSDGNGNERTNIRYRQ